MTQTTSAANKAKTTKHAASSFAVPDYGILDSRTKCNRAMRTGFARLCQAL